MLAGESRRSEMTFGRELEAVLRGCWVMVWSREDGSTGEIRDRIREKGVRELEIFERSKRGGRTSSRTNLNRRRLTTDVENRGFRAEYEREHSPRVDWIDDE